MTTVNLTNLKNLTNPINTVKEYKERINKLTQDLIDFKILNFKEVTLSSGIKSPYYVDFRQGFSNNKFINDVTDILSYYLINILKINPYTGEESDDNTNNDTNNDINNDTNNDTNNDKNNDINNDTNNDIQNLIHKLGCLPLGSIPYGTILSEKINIPLIAIRSKAKSYGKKKFIEGDMNIDDNVLIFDDVLTSGESLLFAIKKVTERGGNIEKVIVLLDRNEGGTENINYYYPDIKIHSLFNINNVINFLEINYINNEYKFVIEAIRTHKERMRKLLIQKFEKINLSKKLLPLYEVENEKWYVDNYLNLLNPKLITNNNYNEYIKEINNKELDNDNDIKLTIDDNKFKKDIQNSNWLIGRNILDFSNETNWYKIKTIIEMTSLEVELGFNNKNNNGNNGGNNNGNNNNMNKFLINKINGIIIDFNNIEQLNQSILKDIYEVKKKYMLNIYSKTEIPINNFVKTKVETDVDFESIVQDNIFNDHLIDNMINECNLIKNSEVENQIEYHINNLVTQDDILELVDFYIMDLYINSEKDIQLLIEYINYLNELKRNNSKNKGICIKPRCINIMFSVDKSEISSLCKNDKIWESLVETLYLQNKSSIIQALIMNFNYLNNDLNIKLTKKYKLNKIIPMILNMTDFNLSKTMFIGDFKNNKLEFNNNICSVNIELNSAIKNNNFNFFILGDDLINSKILFNSKFELYNNYLSCHLFQVYKNNFLLNNVNRYIINLFTKKYNEKEVSNLDKYENINQSKHFINEYTRKNNFINYYINNFKNNLTQINIQDKFISQQKENLLKIMRDEIEINNQKLKERVDNGFLNNLQNIGFKKTLHLYSQYYLAN